MIKNNNVIDISRCLEALRKQEDMEYGVMLTKSYIDVMGEPDSKFHIEIYESGGYWTGLGISFGQDERLAELTVDEAVELGEAILLAARGYKHE